VNESLECLQSCVAFARTDEAALKELAAGSELRTFAQRQPVYLASDRADSVYLLISGRIAVGHVNELGKRAWLTFVRPGELFGEQSLFEWPARDQYAAPFQISRVLIIPARVFRPIILACPEFGASMLRLVGERLMQTNRRWTRQFYLSNRERLIHILLDLADQYGSRRGDVIEFTIDLSHEDLAGFTGSTRESVSVEIGRLREAGLIASSRRRLVLCQPQRWLGLVSR